LPTTWDENEIHIIGLLIDPTGKIDNAGKATITEAVSNGYVNGSNAGLYENLTNQLDEIIKVYPNPASDAATIEILLQNEASVQIKLIDASGKEVSSRDYGKVNGSWIVPVDTKNLESGMYLIQLEINGQTISKRLIVE
jgi:hypothetical protein